MDRSTPNVLPEATKPLPVTLEPGEMHDEESLLAWARYEFPDKLNDLPGVTEVTFGDVDEQKEYVNPYGGNINWPKDRLAKLLLVGKYDSPGQKCDVYAFIHGENSNRVGHVREGIDIDSPVYQKIDPDMLRHVEFQSPFAELGDGTEVNACTGRLRTLICYYFLKAGYVNKVGGYKSFLREFKVACAWVSNEGLKPPFEAPFCTSQSAKTQNNCEVEVIDHGSSSYEEPETSSSDLSSVPERLSEELWCAQTRSIKRERDGSENEAETHDMWAGPVATTKRTFGNRASYIRTRDSTDADDREFETTLVSVKTTIENIYGKHKRAKLGYRTKIDELTAELEESRKTTEKMLAENQILTENATAAREQKLRDAEAHAKARDKEVDGRLQQFKAKIKNMCGNDDNEASGGGSSLMGMS